jgi:vitamin B12 transporter
VRSYLFIILSYIFLLSALAALASEQSTPLRLPKIIVKGAAISVPNVLNTADVTRITTKDIEEQQSVTLADALRRVPGAYVRQNGGIGQDSRISLRGAGESHTILVLNGMPLNDSGALDGAANLSRWTLDEVADIQVIRGPMSSLYGPSGIGGVVSIETKKGKGSHKTFGKAEGGSFNTYAQSLGIQGEKGLLNYHIVGSRIQSAGAPTTPSQFLTRIQGKADNPLHQESFSGRIGGGRESANISFFTRYLNRRLGFRVNPVDLQPYRQNLTESFNRLQGHFESCSGKWRHEIGLGHYQSDLASKRFFPFDRKEYKGTQTQLDWRQTFDAMNHLQLQLNSDLSKETLHRNGNGIPSTRPQTSHGGVGGAFIMKPKENLMIVGSTRVDKYKSIPVTTTYRIGTEYSFEKIVVKGGIGTAFKAPTLQQRFNIDPFFPGNPNLKPERNLGWDLGGERSFFQKRLSVVVTLFQNRIRDLIVSSNDRKTLVNMDKSRTQGLEGTARFHLTPEWTLELAHTYTLSWDEKTARPLIGNPLNKTTFRMAGNITPDWQVSGNMLYIGPRDTFNAITFIRGKTPSYTIFGAETSYQINDKLQVYGRGENLLNRQYQSPTNFQQPGLGLYAGLRTQW